MSAAINASLDALARKWYIAVLVFVVGIGLGIVLYARNAAGLIGYRATSEVRIVSPTVAGVQLPCTPATVEALVKYVPALDAPGATLSALLPSRLSTALAAPDVMTINYTGTDPQLAANGAKAYAYSLVSYCATETQRVTAAATQALSAQRAQLDGELGPVDTQVGITKDRSALVAQRDALNVKIISLDAAAKSAQAQLAAAIPVARNEIEQADPVYVNLKKQLDADLATYAQVAAAYRSTYARVIGLNNRVTVDREQLDARSAELASQPLELSASYRTALAASDAAESALGVAQQQLDDIQARIAHDDKVVGKNPGATAARSQDALAKAFQNVVAAQAAMQLQLVQLPPGGPVTVLGTTAPEQSVKTGVAVALALSLVVALLALVFGVLLAVLIGLLDRRLLTVAQFTKLYGKPVIATLKPKG